MNISSIKKIIFEEFQRENLHFFVVLACLLMQMLSFGQAYRLFAYVNLLIVMFYGFNYSRKYMGLGSKKLLLYVLSIPLGFIVIHFFAVGNLVIIKEMRHIILASFLALGIWILAKKNHDYIRKRIFGFTIALIFIYVTSQAVALWWFNQLYGTAKNPHYLALYSAVSLIVAVYCFFRVPTQFKWVIAIFILLSGVLLIKSSSRPTWIGLICASFLVVLFLSKRSRIYFSLFITTVLIGLTLTNVGNFEGRFKDLLTNLNTEERVVIWQDAWKMQRDSSVTQWVVGHGLDTFEKNYKPYSHYHLEKVDFNSPHNFILELLYISGVFGLLLAIFMLVMIYKSLIFNINRQTKYKNIYLLLMAVLTSNLILVSITLPFFTSYNLNVLAVVAGSMLYLREALNRQA